MTLTQEQLTAVQERAAIRWAEGMLQADFIEMSVAQEQLWWECCYAAARAEILGPEQLELGEPLQSKRPLP